MYTIICKQTKRDLPQTPNHDKEVILSSNDSSDELDSINSNWYIGVRESTENRTQNSHLPDLIHLPIYSTVYSTSTCPPPLHSPTSVTEPSLAAKDMATKNKQYPRMNCTKRDLPQTTKHDKEVMLSSNELPHELKSINSW